MSFRGSINVKRWKDAVRNFPSILFREMAPAMDRVRLDFQGKMVLNRLSGPAPRRLMPRTGAGRRSFRSMRFGSKVEELGVRWYFSRGIAPYMEAHEPPPAVSNIRPIRAKMLAIPLRDAKAPGGALRGEYATRKGQTLRSLPGIFLIRVAKSDKLFLVKRVGGELKFLFVLKSHVRVRRRLDFRGYLKNQSKRLFKFLMKGLKRAERAFEAKKR